MRRFLSPLLAVCFFVLAVPAWAFSPAVVGTSSQASPTTAATIVWAHTVPASATGLFVGIGLVTGSTTITSVAWSLGSGDAAELWEVQGSTSTKAGGWLLTNPVVGTGTITVTLSSTTSGGTAGGVNLAGIEASSVAAAHRTVITGNSGAAGISVTATSVIGDLVIDSATINTNSISTGSGQASRVEDDAISNGTRSWGISTEVATSTSTIMSWNESSGSWASGAVALIPGGIAPPVSSCTGASPIWTCGPSYDDINALINSGDPAGFTRNDTVNVTAGDGTETWGAVLTLTKGVKLTGPGYASLIIDKSSGYIINITPDATAILNEERIEVSGFTLSGNDLNLILIHVQGAGASSLIPWRGLVIHHNKFKDMAVVSSSAGTVWVAGQVTGVISTNIFDRNSVVFRALGNLSVTEWTNGHFPFAYGSSENLFFETNTIQWSTATAPGAIPGWTESGQGGRQVIRYNTWDFANVNCSTTPNTFCELWDMHGFQNYTGSPSYPEDGQTGTMISEIYANRVLNKDGYRLSNSRGSWSLIHNNIVTGVGGVSASQNIGQYDRGCNSWVKSTWPPPNVQPNNSYTFNTTNNGVTINTTVTPASGVPNVSGALNNSCPPVEDTDFRNYSASCTGASCAAGIGRGTTAPVGTCTQNTAYWVASTATPTVDPSIIQEGKLYKCTATNTWTLYATPYTYPHPYLAAANPPAPAAIGATNMANYYTATMAIFQWPASADPNHAAYNVYRCLTDDPCPNLIATITPASAALAHQPENRYVDSSLYVGASYYFSVADQNLSDYIGATGTPVLVTVTGKQ